MDGTIMVVLIVAISVMGGVINQALKTRQKALDARPASGPDQEALLREIASLRQRVAALEAIVTEPSYELKRKISELDTSSRAAA